VKGFNVWKGYGTKIMEEIISILENLLNETRHSKTYFPLLIPKDLFGKESEHLRGFEDQVFWVERAGKRKVPRKLVVRPTSETAMYRMFSLWVRSHADLPIKVYQTVSVFRYETKSTTPLIRDREMWPFNEAHTVHATLREAEKQIEIGLRLYKELFRRLALPYLLVKKPDWELFPGAILGYEFYTLFPDGKVLETGSVNNLGQSFSKVFDIAFEKEDGTRDYAYQTCYGQSERLLASVIAIHGDDHGLVLPPSIAPTSVVIVPIINYEKGEDVLNYAATIEKLLREKGFAVTLDDRDLTPGEKFYYWEKRGIPIRLEIGPQEQNQKAVTIVQRHNLRRKKVQVKGLVKEIEKTLNEIEHELSKQSQNLMKKRIASVLEIQSVSQALKKGKNILRMPFCGKEKCKDEIEDKTGMEVIGLSMEKNTVQRKCLSCGEETKESAYLARSY
jgi:prolyl-tRNA synthetase